MTLATAKQQLRNKMRSQRREFPHRAVCSQQIIDRLEQLPFFATSRLLGFYADVRGEVATRDALTRAWQRGQRTALPYCDGEELRFVMVENMNDLVAGKFGVAEPAGELRAANSINFVDMDVILVPGLAFDVRGNRLGYGRGYYDRAIATSRHGPITVGLAYAFQLVANVPVSKWDQPVDWIVTETQTVRVVRD